MVCWRSELWGLRVSDDNLTDDIEFGRLRIQFCGG